MCKKRKIYTMAEANAALMNAFNLINSEFYGSELDNPIITIKEGAKKKAFGWIEVNKNWVQGGNEKHELNISCDYLNRNVDDIIATLMHEMVHLYNIANDIKDTSRSGIYHNKKFKQTAEAHGLEIEFTEHIGWSITKLKEDTRKWVNDNISISEFKIYKKKERGRAGGSSKQSSRKYTCPCCGLIVRATKECNIICADCNEVMEKIEN